MSQETLLVNGQTKGVLGETCKASSVVRHHLHHLSDDLGVPIQLITSRMRLTDVIMRVTLVGKLDKVDVELLQLYITPHLQKTIPKEMRTWRSVNHDRKPDQR